MLDVEVRHRVHAGLELDVALHLGATCGVLFGRSGAGKTTLLNLIAGLIRPDAGRVALGGAALFDSAQGVDVPLRRRRVGLIFQDDGLFPHLDTGANIAYGLHALSMPERRARRDEVAALCGVAHVLDRRPASLSGGERQRVGLARALAPRPRLLLCDEPVSALDVAARLELLDLLRRVPAAEQIPVVVVTHSPAEAVAVGDRLFRLDGGRIVAEGPPLEVLAAAALGPGAWADPIQNVLRGTIAGHDRDAGSTRVRLDGPGAPELAVPLAPAWPDGAAVTVAVRADDVLLARPPAGTLAGRLSARNVLDARVTSIVAHDGASEVVAVTGPTRWTASVVAGAVAALGLAPGAPVALVVKARSCRLLGGPPTASP